MSIKKQLVSIEFRYIDKPNGDYDGGFRNKSVTIGTFDTLEEAIVKGNEALTILSKKFEVRADDKFMLKHLFGAPKRLVTNTCYPTKGIQYFATIETLMFDDLNDVINETFEASDRYINYKNAKD